MGTEKERLKKIYELALRGTDGEKEQAKAILDKLLIKYEMSLEELSEDKVEFYSFDYHGIDERRILNQTIYKVTGDINNIFDVYNSRTGRKKKTQSGTYCTKAQKAEIEFLFEFYKTLWEKEKEALLLAFIHKHDIYGSLKEGEKGREISSEEIKKMALFMVGLSDEQPVKALSDGKGKG